MKLANCDILGIALHHHQMEWNAAKVFENRQKKSHSTLRAKRATFTFWLDKSSLKMPKMVHFDETSVKQFFFSVFPDFFIRLFVVLVSLLSIVPQYRISCIFFRQSNALIVWTFSDSWTSVLPQIQNCCSSFWVILSLWLSLGSFGCHLWLIPKFRLRDFKTAWISRNWGGYTCTHVQKKPNVQQDWKCDY